jgi:hypothetical protein
MILVPFTNLPGPKGWFALNVVRNRAVSNSLEASPLHCFFDFSLIFDEKVAFI